MGYQDDYVMRTITDLVRTIAGVALGKNEIDYELPSLDDAYTPADRIYRHLKEMVDAGDINGAENELYEALDVTDRNYLEMALAFYMYLNQLMIIPSIPPTIPERRSWTGSTVSAPSSASAVLSTL